MKKLVGILLGAAVCAAAATAQGFSALEWEVYGGLGIEMAQVKGMEDVRISDVRKYGAAEGSLLLPLDDANGFSVPVTITLGGQTEIIDNVAVLAELCAGIIDSNSYVGNFDLGAKYYFVNDKFRFGAGLKAGVYYLEKSLGKAEVLAGTTPPVILDEGTVRDGDSLSYTVFGASVTPMLDVGYWLTEKFSIGCNVGYQLGFSFSSKFKAGDVEINPKDSDDIYEARTDGFYSLDLDPTVTLNGVKASLYVSYKL